jgi:hypothetical protein
LFAHEQFESRRGYAVNPQAGELNKFLLQVIQEKSGKSRADSTSTSRSLPGFASCSTGLLPAPCRNARAANLQQVE